MIKKTSSLPWPQNKTFMHKIVPIFIPFAGCERRCIFCAQHLQSGAQYLSSEHKPQNITPPPVTQSVLNQSYAHIEDLAKSGKTPAEVAFYGGTFTAFAPKDFELCCDFVKKLYESGHINKARCSTRPDAITKDKLLHMQQAGFTCIELGVQSFNNKALEQAQRHYTKQDIEKACTLIRAHGFSLGIQLLPGMPGVSPQIFIEDVHEALCMRADFLRFYPCQVIEGTPLANLWRQGEFSEWSLQTTIDALSQGWLRAHLAHVPVIRMGLAPEVHLEQHILAGPRHAALGSIIQGQALHMYITQAVAKAKIHSLTLPHACQGYFWGHAKSLESTWMKYGLQKNSLKWHDKAHIDIIYM